LVPVKKNSHLPSAGALIDKDRPLAEAVFIEFFALTAKLV
jgi:hypothetical protein